MFRVGTAGRHQELNPHDRCNCHEATVRRTKGWPGMTDAALAASPWSLYAITKTGSGRAFPPGIAAEAHRDWVPIKLVMALGWQ